MEDHGPVLEKHIFSVNNTVATFSSGIMRVQGIVYIE